MRGGTYRSGTLPNNCLSKCDLGDCAGCSLEGVLSMCEFTNSIFAATIGAALLVATATPSFAQAYCACWGTGNVSDTPLLEKTNGAYGWGHVSPSARRCSIGLRAKNHRQFSLRLFEPSHEA